MELDFLEDFLAQHQLPLAYRHNVEAWFYPIANSLKLHHESAGRVLVIGINGAQGSGKSTLAGLLVQIFKRSFSLNAVSLSLDDFYFSGEQRTHLAEFVHPLFKTRGVPGTHDVALAIETINELKSGNIPLQITRFNKALDEPFGTEHCDTVTSPVDIIVLEGWCLGAEPQMVDELAEPINELERKEDPNCIWREYVNQQLLSSYPALFDEIDSWIMLKAPSFDCIYDWRLEQENKLNKTVEEGAENKVMSHDEVSRFIKHFERVTTHLLTTLPGKVDFLIELDASRKIKKATDINNELFPVEQLLIFTDMDGSLMSHYDYSYDAALPLLAELKQDKIPVIPTTSKTYSELVVLRKDLALEDEFIVENGAAIYIPKQKVDTQPLGTLSKPGFWVKEFVEPRAHWLNLLGKLSSKYRDCYHGFSEMELSTIKQLTGLNHDSALRASQREYGEPVYWYGDQQKKQLFIEDVIKLGGRVLEGGRFMHISGACDKGEALKWLATMYQADFTTVTSIAIGDSQNDISMLEVADIALMIASPSHDFPTLNRQNNIYKSTETAPLGWVQGISTILDELPNPE